MNQHLFVYSAFVESVYDGDTITVNIDLGFGINFKNQKIRLLGIDTPELRGEERPEGLKVRDWLRDKIDSKLVILKTYKDSKGKYGRWLADVFIDGECINADLVAQGYGASY